MTRLLIVGGLTIDRFADGTSAPGGAVIHAGRAAAADGVPLTILTVAGDEPEAAEGLAELAELGDLIHQRAFSTVTYGHTEIGDRRVLTFLGGAAPIVPPVLADPPDVALLAPIADELPASTIRAMRDAARPRVTVLLLQGWLRSLDVGMAVRPLGLGEVPGSTWNAFSAADGVVVSAEDIADAPADPIDAVARLRERLGPRVTVVMTLGSGGYVLDDPSVDRVIEGVPGRVVDGVPTVGAGDTFGVALAVQLADGTAAAAAASIAAERVIRMLEARRP
jgi:sugar/nucleoside kinase (ribokinase family)